MAGRSAELRRPARHLIAVFLFVLLLVNFIYFKHALKDPAVAQETFLGNARLSIETHADMTSYLTLLLATLGIMIGLFTVTGFINRMPVWGELSPPNSLTAAIAARIAEASFMRTMWEALRICLPITLITFAIFSRSEMVVHPGWTQVASTLVVTIGTCGTALGMFGRIMDNPAADLLLRAVLVIAAFIALFYPDDNASAATAAFVLAATIFGIMRHRRIAPRHSGWHARPTT